MYPVSMRCGVSMRFLWKIIIAMESIITFMELLYLKMNDSHDVFYFKLRSRAQSILLSIHVNSASLFLAVYSALWERMEREQTFTRAYIGSTDILNTPRLNLIHIHIECHCKALVFPETTIIKPVDVSAF